MHGGMSRVIKILRSLERKMKLIGRWGERGGWRGLDLLMIDKGYIISKRKIEFIVSNKIMVFIID